MRTETIATDDIINDEVNVTVVKKKKPVEAEASLKKGGRPKSKDPKNQKVMTYFTENEKMMLLKIAESKDLSLSNFIRICALEKIN